MINNIYLDPYGGLMLSVLAGGLRDIFVSLKEARAMIFQLYEDHVYISITI